MPKWGMIVVGTMALVAAAMFLFQNELESNPDSTPEAPEVPAIADPTPDHRPTVRPAAVEPPSGKQEHTQEAEVAMPTPVRVLPALAESDPFVRKELEPLGLPRDWVSQDDLVRRLAVFADNATRGELARRNLVFLKPTGRFNVVEREGRLYADPRNVLRFDPILDLLEGIEPAAAATFLKTIEPILETALQELGSSLSLEQALDEVIERILAMPENPIGQELVQAKVLYEYKDARYETLPPFEKQLLRLGMRNLQRLERYLRALRAELTSTGQPIG
jgi:hypothetical protein